MLRVGLVGVKLIRLNREAMLKVGLGLSLVSVVCWVCLLSVKLLLEAESGGVIWSLCLGSIGGLRGEVMKGFAPANVFSPAEGFSPANGVSEEAKCRALRFFLNLVKTWRSAGIQVTMIPTFCSTLAP